MCGDMLFLLVLFKLHQLVANFFPLRRLQFLAQTLYSGVNFAAGKSCKLMIGHKPQ